MRAVGEFRKLALLAESDGHLRQKLQQVLKLSKEKWDDARDHAMRAVVADNRMRIWYADKASMELGLLFTCRLGNVDLDRPVGTSLEPTLLSPVVLISPNPWTSGASCDFAQMILFLLKPPPGVSTYYPCS